MKASLAIQVAPQYVSEERVIEVVDRVIEMIIDSGLSYVVSACETTIESDELAPLLDIIAKTQEIIADEGIGAATYMKLFYNEHAGVMTIDEKISKYKK